MNTFFKTFFACLLAIIVHGVFIFFMFFFIASGVVAMFGTQESFNIKSNSILKIDLGMHLSERHSSNPMDNFDYSTFKYKPTTTLFEAISLIEKAANDPLIDGIYLNITSANPNSLATMYELRQAIEKFRKESGKFVVAFGDTYSQAGYYLATSADKIYLNPQGGFEWGGMSSSVMFYKGMFDKLGIQPEIIRHGKFKGAVEPYMLDRMSPENRLQMEELLKSLWGYMVGEIGESRDIDSVLLQKYASEMTIQTPAIAMEKGLVDSLFYSDQFYDELSRLTVAGDPRFVTLAQYKTANRTAVMGDIGAPEQIAVVYADGEIVDGGDENKNIVGNAFAEQLRKLRKNDNVKAVVLRVNSPGGSVLASDIIWREISLIKAVKPVVVSMGSYAASGGYYISCPADDIVATPGTLTGSIGVFGMMFNVEKGAKEKLGLTVDVVKTNPMADMGSIFRALSPAERMLVQNGVDSVYVRFVGLVANGRSLEYENVDEMAQGRVWSGLQAIDNKLVDKIGTLSDAIQLAAERAGLVSYRIATYPQADESFSTILRSISEVSMKYIGSSIGLIPEVDKVQQAVERHQGVWAKMPYQMEIK